MKDIALELCLNLQDTGVNGVTNGKLLDQLSLLKRESLYEFSEADEFLWNLTCDVRRGSPHLTILSAIGKYEY